MLNLNIFIPGMASALFHDGQLYLKYDQCNVHVNTQHRHNSENNQADIVQVWFSFNSSELDSEVGRLVFISPSYYLTLLSPDK